MADPLILNTAQATLVNVTEANLDSAFAGGLKVDNAISGLLPDYATMAAETKVSVRLAFKSTAAAMVTAMGSPTWTNITLGTGWSATNTTTFHPPSYTVTGWNTLKLRGHLTPSALAGTSFGTLPAGARPTKTLTKVIPGATGVAIFTVTNAGAMSVSVVTTSADYSLDGLEVDLT
jgi:hypothetical protein